jgi:predicted ATPase
VITTLIVVGFKRFTSHRFNFAPLTILTGMNGAGKTSLIHSILLAREAGDARRNEVVSLNGPFGLDLGTVSDVKNWSSTAEVEFVVEDNTRTFHYKLDNTDEDALYMYVRERSSGAPLAFSNIPRTFSYLSAERLGPRSSMLASALHPEHVEIGVRGENCAQILETLGAKALSAGRLHPEKTKDVTELLKYQVEHWLLEIVSPVEISAERYPGSAVTRLRFDGQEGNGSGLPTWVLEFRTLFQSFLRG